MTYRSRYGCIHTIGKKTNNRCHLCHERLEPDDYGSTAGPLGGDAVNVDHLWPQSWGGDDDDDNLMLSHARCNSIRGTRDVEEVRMELAGTPNAPRSGGEVMFEMGAGAVLGAIFGGAITTEPGQGLNPVGCVVGAVLGLLLTADW